MISLWDIDRISLFDPILETLFLRRISMDETPSGFLEKKPLV